MDGDSGEVDGADGVVLERGAHVHVLELFYVEKFVVGHHRAAGESFEDEEVFPFLGGLFVEVGLENIGEFLGVVDAVGVGFVFGIGAEFGGTDSVAEDAPEFVCAASDEDEAVFRFEEAVGIDTEGWFFFDVVGLDVKVRLHGHGGLQ